MKHLIALALLVSTSAAKATTYEQFFQTLNPSQSVELIMEYQRMATNACNNSYRKGFEMSEVRAAAVCSCFGFKFSAPLIRKMGPMDKLNFQFDLIEAMAGMENVLIQTLVVCAAENPEAN